MKHILRISLAILSASFIFSSCRTGTEPSVAPGMSAYIDGTYWVADSTFATVNGTCLTIIGYSDTGTSKMITLQIPSSQAAPDSCALSGTYTVASDQMLMLPNNGTLFLKGKTSSAVQGTFGFHGVVFRSSDTTYITNGEFNVNLAN